MEQSPEALGLKCGLEIHQQLRTGKLFSRRPSVLNEGEPDFTFVRTLRASAGESGEVDAAAQAETIKRKRFVYHGFHQTCGLIEMDEEPPHSMDEEALVAALQACLLLESTVIPQVTVMRKTVIDGSNTSGFQRTALIGIGGKLPMEGVRVQTVCLEEDAAQIISRGEHEDVYNLSRLGIPLIEIATEPDITTPEQAQRTAAEIGMLLRSTGKCKRGLGTIRQDVNVSIREGARVEIKGAQDLRLLPDLVRNEMLRQDGLVKLAKRVEIELPPAPQNMTELFRKTKCAFVKRAVDKGSSVMGLKLIGMHGILGEELLPGYRVGTELAGYAKVFGFGGLIHGDEDLAKYPFTGEITAVRKHLKCTKKDSFILLVGDDQRASDCFAFSLVPRIEELGRGVPSEVRRANPDGTTSYLRPMPGAARMYPETDIPIVNAELTVERPKLLAEQEEALVKLGVAPAQAKELLREGWDLHAYAKRFPTLEPKFLAVTLIDTPKELRRRYQKEIRLAEHTNELDEILHHIAAGKVPREAIIDCLRELADGKKPDVSLYESADAEAIARVVDEVIAADPKAPLNALMGAAMAKLRGKASGKEVMKELKERMT